MVFHASSSYVGIWKIMFILKTGGGEQYNSIALLFQKVFIATESFMLLYSNA